MDEVLDIEDERERKKFIQVSLNIMIIKGHGYIFLYKEQIYSLTLGSVMGILKQARVHNKLRPFAGTIPDNF